ncbi:hypothetical protein [Stenotrophomonas sp.]|uniref:hypothetical protein n=1 Tax=Stenotrophomonas sp. TaxID=69392 RepID=UPI002FC6B609
MNMTRYATGVLAAVLATAFLASPVAAKPRHGVIEEVQPIENRGDDTSTKTKRGRTIGERLGKFGGVAVGSGLVYAGEANAGFAVTAASDTYGQRVGGAIGEKVAGTGPTTRYMVKVRLDEGRVLNTTQLREQINGLAVGSRVTVEGSGDEAVISAE